MATVLGISPYRDASAFALWARLVGIEGPRSADDAAQARGHMMEPGILLRMTAEIGLPGTAAHPVPRPLYPVLEKPRWRHATPDGLLYQTREHDGRTGQQLIPVGTLEAKALESDDGFGEPGTSDIRPDYLVQVLWQLACTTVPVGYLGLAHGYRMMGWGVYRVERDDAREAALVARVRSWWDSHVETLIPPPIDGTEATARALARAYRAVAGKTVEATPSDRQTIEQIRVLDEHLAERRERRRLLANQLRARMGDAVKLVDDRETLARYTTRKDGSRALTVTKRRKR